MTQLRCIAVDDEPLALKLVETFIEQTPFYSSRQAATMRLKL